MIREKKASLLRLPLYLGISAVAVVLAIAVVYVAVQVSGGSMFDAADARSHIKSSGSPVDETARDVSGVGLLLSAAVFLLAPSCASLIAILAVNGFIDFEDRKVGILFRLLTLILVLVGLWFLAPSVAAFKNKQGGTLVPQATFRWVYLCLNGVVGLIVAAMSGRRRTESRS